MKKLLSEMKKLIKSREKKNKRAESYNELNILQNEDGLRIN